MAPQYREKMKNLPEEKEATAEKRKQNTSNFEEDKSVASTDSSPHSENDGIVYNQTSERGSLLSSSDSSISLVRKRLKTDASLDASIVTTSTSSTGSHHSSLLRSSSLHGPSLLQSHLFGSSLDQHTAFAASAALVSAARSGRHLEVRPGRTPSSAGCFGSSLASLGTANALSTTMSGMQAPPLGLAGAAELTHMNLLANRLHQVRQTSLMGRSNSMVPNSVTSSNQIGSRTSSSGNQFGLARK